VSPTAHVESEKEIKKLKCDKSQQLLQGRCYSGLELRDTLSIIYKLSRSAGMLNLAACKTGM
jgi:hypothetical protein